MGKRCDCALSSLCVGVCVCVCCGQQPLPFRMDGLDSGVITEHYGKQRPLSHSQPLLLFASSFSLSSVSSLRLTLSPRYFSTTLDSAQKITVALTTFSRFCLLSSCDYHFPFSALHYLSISLTDYHLFSVLLPSNSYLHCISMAPNKSESQLYAAATTTQPVPSFTSVSMDLVHEVECQHPPPHYQQNTTLQLPTSLTSVAFCPADLSEPLPLLEWSKPDMTKQTAGQLVGLLSSSVCLCCWCGYLVFLYEHMCVSKVAVCIYSKGAMMPSAVQQSRKTSSSFHFYMQQTCYYFSLS